MFGYCDKLVIVSLLPFPAVSQYPIITVIIRLPNFRCNLYFCLSLTTVRLSWDVEMRLPPWKLDRESKLKDLTEEADEDALVAEDTEETPEAKE